MIIYEIPSLSFGYLDYIHGWTPWLENYYHIEGVAWEGYDLPSLT